MVSTPTWPGIATGLLELADVSLSMAMYSGALTWADVAMLDVHICVDWTVNAQWKGSMCCASKLMSSVSKACFVISAFALVSVGS